MDAADAVLLERWVGRRDAEAFQALVKRHSTMVFSACRRVLGDPARAEDVTQECFLKLATGDARPGPFLGPWLHRMATRRCLDTLRAERRRRAREARYAAVAPQSVEVKWETLEPLIDEALAELPERFRVPITAHYLEGQTQEEIAQRLGTPRSTVSYRISQGLERMGVRLRARGVNVGAGVLGTRLAALPTETLPADLAAKLSKMALARAARVLPKAHRLPGPALTYGAGALVLALVAVAGWTGVNRLFAAQDAASVSISGTQAVKPASEVPKGTGRAARSGSETVPVATNALRVDPASNLASSEGPLPSVAAPAKDEPKPCAIAGSVVDEARLPVPNATVRVFLEAIGAVVTSTTKVLSTRTDAGGLFRIADIPAHQFVLEVGAEGFDSSPVTSYLLAPGSSLEDQCIILSKGVTLSGKVLGRDGLPVPNALVVRESYYSDTNSGGGDNADQTDAKGFFQLGFPAEVTAVVRVLTQQWGDAVFEVNVQPGVPVELRMPESARVTGRVTREDGTPADDLRVAFRPLSGSGTTIGFYTAFTVEGGYYEMASLPPDLEYEALVVDMESNAMSRKDPLGVLAAGSTTQHDFQLEAPGRVIGTVTGEQTGRPQKGARIGWIRDKESTDSAATTGEDGTYELKFFAPGTYWIYPVLTAGEREGDPVREYGRSVNVTLGKDQTIDLRMPDAFSLGVRVVDGQGKPLPDAPVSAVFSPEPPSISFFAHGQTDASGRFRFEAFRPGFESWLVAHAPEQDLLARVGQPRNGSKAVETTHVTGEAGIDYPEETVVLYGSSGLSGVAVGPGGQPLANSRIDFSMNSPGIEIDGARLGALSTGGGTQTDASGAFTLFEGVPATMLSVSAAAQTEDGRAYRCDLGAVNCLAGQVMDFGKLPFQIEATAPTE